MITDYNKFNESISNFDLDKLVTIINIKKTKNGDWVYIDNNKKEYFLPKSKIDIITKIDDNLANFVNSGNPITKYFELNGNEIVYAANFAVDGVILRDGHVYLIERKDGRGWALPGGFIDAGDSAKQAVIRELEEETLLKKENIKTIKPLNIIRANDPREINFFTYPFVITIDDDVELKFADDAINSKWLFLNRAIKNNNLAFTHHIDILKLVDY